MKNIKTYITAVFAAALFCSCTFEDMPFDKYDSEFVFNNKKKAEGYVLGVYQVLPYVNTQSNGYNRVDGAMLSSATDESAVTRSGWSSIVTLTDGSLTARKTNPDGCWGDCYTYIRDANIGIAGLEGLPEADHDYKVHWQAELRFLKAFAYFELLKRYGGVPLLDRAYELTENLNVPRSSFADCVKYISDLCDEAALGLPDPNDTEFGRASKGTALALKARLLLYAASPLYNGTGYDNSGNEFVCYGNTDRKRWESAAEAAAEVINLGHYNIYTPKEIADSDPDAQVIAKGEENYRKLFLTISGNKELVLSRTSVTGNEVEKQNLPFGITSAQGLTSPSQQIVDAYGMVNGKARTAGDGGYDQFNPYANRDPRFYGSIFHNGQTWGGTVIETFTGGAHNNTTGSSTVTGYYMSKFCNSEVVISGTETKTYHCFPLMRYAEVLLNYAEASNEAWGPDTDECSTGLTPRDAVKLVRSRVLRPSETDVDVAANDAPGMRDAIRHERRIELAFEDHRYFDLKRWMAASTVLNENIRGIRITPQGNGFAYTPVENVSIRQFTPKFHVYPIPNSDVVNNSAIQGNNPMW